MSKEKKEQITVVFDNQKIRVEDIKSFGTASPDGFWYDSEIDEFVMLTAGGATLLTDAGNVTLSAGESLYISAHTRHRVTSTTPDCRWLCVYLKA